LDLYPTLCDLANLPKPNHLEGISFAPLLTAGETTARDAACSEMRRGGRLGRSIRTAEFRYTEWRDRRNRVVARELYDHRQDKVPGELEVANIVNDPQMSETVQRLSQRLHKRVPHRAIAVSR